MYIILSLSSIIDDRQVDIQCLKKVFSKSTSLTANTRIYIKQTWLVQITVCFGDITGIQVCSNVLQICSFLSILNVSSPSSQHFMTKELYRPAARLDEVPCPFTRGNNVNQSICTCKNLWNFLWTRVSTCKDEVFAHVSRFIAKNC